WVRRGRAQGRRHEVCPLLALPDQCWRECGPPGALRPLRRGDILMGIGLGHKRHLGLMLLIVSSVIVLDQISKWSITSTMRLHESISVIHDLFNITYIRNSGAAFGILAGSHAGFRLVFFGLTSVLAQRTPGGTRHGCRPGCRTPRRSF